MGELQTVIWKEVRDLLGPSKTRNQALISVGALVVMTDFVFPFTTRSYEGSLGQILGFSIFIGILFCITTVPDMVAGERERHTLETLLSTRIPDRTLLNGKLITMMAGVALLSGFVIVQGVVVVSLLFGRWDQTLTYLAFGPVALVGSLILSFAMSCLGLAVSARAQTVQGAQQLLAFAMMPFMLLFFMAPFLLSLGLFGALGWDAITSGDFVLLGIILGASIVAAFLGAGILLYWWALTRFRRHKLMIR